ncbi:glutamate ligase domain-containing protein, partial [Helicobacter pylori]
LEEIRNNLLNFKGIKKRFDILQKNDLILIDDYAHHPTEIGATLKSARIYANLLNTQEKIVVIWQAHKYSRLMDN